MVGCELTPGEISSETRASPPEGELAVLPIHIETGAGQLTLTVSSPVKEIATLGRRMLGEDDPDNKEQELNTDVFDAIGEILNLMSGGVDQALRSELSVGGSPGTWWRTDEPGEQSFERTSSDGSASLPYRTSSREASNAPSRRPGARHSNSN
jgi:hypothetical protein